MGKRAALLGVVVGLSMWLIAALSVRVARLEANELLYESAARSLLERLEEPSATRISARLGATELRRGEHAMFEVCSDSPMHPAQWRNALDLVVWRPEAGEVELKVPLDQAHLDHMRRSSRGACLPLGGGRIEEGGRYVLDAVFHGRTPPPAVLRAPLRARILARQPLTRWEGAAILGLALCGMVAVFAGFAPARAGATVRRDAPGWALTGLLTLLVLGAVVLALPLAGSAGGLARGLSLAVLEVGVAIAFAIRLGTAREQLALYAPRRSLPLVLGVAVGAAALLNPLARLALRVVPASGEAPIETFISWPSGALAFATLGMLVPLAEELLFRGFLFGALEARGRLLAFVVTVFCFAAAHVQQAFGNWGALLAVTLTGAVLTGLRAWSGSTLVPAACHLLYNFSLWTSSFG